MWTRQTATARRRGAAARGSRRGEGRLHGHRLGIGAVPGPSLWVSGHSSCRLGGAAVGTVPVSRCRLAGLGAERVSRRVSERAPPMASGAAAAGDSNRPCEDYRNGLPALASATPNTLLNHSAHASRPPLHSHRALTHASQSDGRRAAQKGDEQM